MACAPGASVPDELAGLLTAKGVAVESASDPLGAFASFVASDGGRGRILLVVEPERAPWAERLARAVERFAPHAVVWAWSSGAKPALHPFARRAEPTRATGFTPASNGSPLLRLVDAEASKATGTNGGAHGVLDADELRLLLGRTDGQNGEKRS